MRKRFIKVSVICALALTSSTAFVGCADYDDDIKNLQEQIDGVTSKLDVSKEELTAAINSSVEALKTAVDKQVADLQALASGNAADIETLKTEIANKTAELQASIEGKADAATVESKFNELKGIVDELNQSVASSLDAAKTELGDKISALETEQDNLSAELDELKAQLDGNASQSEVDALKQKIESLEGELKTTNDQLVEALNKVKAIEDAKFGEQIAALETRIASLESLEETLKDYTDSEISSLNATLTAKIGAEFDKVIAELASDSTDLANQIKAVDGKLANYMTKNDPAFTGLVSRVQALEDYKKDVLELALADKADAEELAGAVSRIQAIEDLLKDDKGQFIDVNEQFKAVDTKLNDLKNDLQDMFGTVIQSIVYEPQYDNNLDPVKFFEFNTLKVKDPNSNDEKVIGQNQTTVIKFRVTPIAAAKTFKDNYNITFEGYKVASRTAPANYLDATFNEGASDLDRGVVAFTVRKNDAWELEKNKTTIYYSLSARVTPKNVETAADEEGIKNWTEVASDYFLCSHNDITVKNISVQPKENSYNLQWNSTATIDLCSGLKLVGTTTSNTTIELIEKFGIDPKTAVTFEKVGTDAEKAAFNVTSAGVVSVADATASSNVGKSIDIKATVALGGYKYTTDVATEFSIVKAETTYPQTITFANDWKSVSSTAGALVPYEQAIDLAPIANHFKLTEADLKTMIDRAVADQNVTYKWSDGQDATSQGVNLSYGAKVRITVDTELTKDMYITINLKGEDWSSTLAGTEYTIKLKVPATKYPTDYTLDQQDALWNGTTAMMQSQSVKDDNGQITDLKVEMDVKTLFEGFASQIAEIQDNGGVVELVREIGLNKKVIYNSQNGTDETKLIITKNTYNGEAIKLKATVKYGNKQANAKTAEYTISVANLSGKLVVNTSQIALSKQNVEKALSGFSWTDVWGNTMWQNGYALAGTYVDGKDTKYHPYAQGYPFTTVFNVADPEFTVVDKDGNKDVYLEYVAGATNISGKVRLTDAAKSATFYKDYQATLVMTVDKPRWGELPTTAGLTPVYDQQGKNIVSYKAEIPVVIQKD